MRAHPALYLIVAIAWALAGGLNLWLWLGEGKPIDLLAASVFLAFLPIWIAHFLIGMRGRKPVERPE